MNDDTQGQAGGAKPVDPGDQGTPAVPQQQQPAQPRQPAQPIPPAPPSASGTPPATGRSAVGTSQTAKQPSVAAGATAQQGAGTPTPPPPKDEKPANFQLGTMLGDNIKLTLQPHPDTKFDDTYFVKLLAGSISLSKAEKKRIIDAIPKLKQWQVDELINIFEEEKKKFANLSERHVPQLKKLEKQHFEEWQDIEMEQEQSGKAEEDKQKADEIRKNLGL